VKKLHGVYRDEPSWIGFADAVKDSSSIDFRRLAAEIFVQHGILNKALELFKKDTDLFNDAICLAAFFRDQDLAHALVEWFSTITDRAAMEAAMEVSLFYLYPLLVPSKIQDLKLPADFMEPYTKRVTITKIIGFVILNGILKIYNLSSLMTLTRAGGRPQAGGARKAEDNNNQRK